MVMSAKALLDRTPRPNDRQIKQALNGHLCRCASHNRIVRAVQRAAEELRAAGRRGAGAPPAEASLPNKEMRS
jgi:nicotinate dehydrogenase subunit A